MKVELLSHQCVCVCDVCAYICVNVDKTTRGRGRLILSDQCNSERNYTDDCLSFLRFFINWLTTLNSLLVYCDGQFSNRYLYWFVARILLTCILTPFLWIGSMLISTVFANCGEGVNPNASALAIWEMSHHWSIIQLLHLDQSLKQNCRDTYCIDKVVCYALR